MPQTLFALLAIVLTSLLALQVTRTRSGDTALSYQTEIEVQSRGVAVAILERLSAYPYDGGEGAGMGGPGIYAYSPSGPKPIGHFGQPGYVEGTPVDDLFNNPAYDDLDDFHGVDDALYSHEVFEPASGETRTLDLDVTIRVGYVAQDASGDWTLVPPPTRTHFKQAFLTIKHPSMNGHVRHSRLFAAP